MCKKLVILLFSVAILTAAACSGKDVNTMDNSANRELILSSDNTNEERNRLLTEDIKYFQKELPKRHKNLFSNITEEEFNTLTNKLIDRVDQFNNKQLLVELNKIVAAVKDAHTGINIWHEYYYPLKFWIFGEKVYVVDTDENNDEMNFSQVLKIDGIDIDTIIKRLTSLVSHENRGWLLAMLPNYLQAPVYMYGLGILQSEDQAVFTVEKAGEVKDYTVLAEDFETEINYVNKSGKNNLIGIFDKNYDYKYLPDNKALYFEYNVCANAEDLSFNDFNKGMFEAIEKNKPDKIIIDLRNNTGGNSEVFNPFTKKLKSYIKKNDRVKVFLLVGRYTFSSGMFAIYKTKDTIPEVVSVGESTGGALDCYGDVRSFNLPNTQIPVNYSTKYFEFSKLFTYKNCGYKTFLPDVLIQPTIDDYKNGKDTVLEYVLKS